MIKIGSRTVVHSATVLLEDEETAEISFEIEKWRVTFVMSFHQEGGAVNGAEWSVENDNLRLRLYRWNNALGTTLTNPAQIGTSPSKKILELMIFQHKVGKINRADLQVSVKDAQ